MYERKLYDVLDIKNIEESLINLVRDYNTGCLLNSHQEFFQSNNTYSSYNFLAAVGVVKEISSTFNHGLSELDSSLNIDKSWYFGFLGYDLKNKIEKLDSNNIDFLSWPDLYFFQPEHILLIGNNNLEILSHRKSKHSPEEIFNQLKNKNCQNKNTQHKNYYLKPRLSKAEYTNKINKLKEHILRGDIYEINFCHEFFTHANFDPYKGYQKLCQVSPTPFSCFFKLNDKYLLSASPERFLKKQGTKLISQPIKGTIKRGTTEVEDKQNKSMLQQNKKERAENIMIVDLVRNDLSRIARKGSVKVDELCGIYSFKQVNHLISTVSATIDNPSIETIIRSTFPMGSMTGAPKIRAMKLSEKYETTKRGLYSGAVGYISPEKDFDFNVVIRSLQYNNENNYLSYMVGGAITFLSEPEKEYEECLVKALALEDMLKNKVYD
jgi:para-aminobenzoate synthetase component 1